MSDIDITPTTYKQQSNSYRNKLKELDTNLNIVIDGLIKSYPDYKIYPDVTELENIYNNNLYNLQDIKTNFFSLQKSVNGSNEKIKIIIDNKNIQLEKLKLHNKKLTTKYNGMSESDQSSIGLRGQFDDQYKQSYLSLVLLMSFTLFTTFISAKQINLLRQTISNK